LLKDGNLRPEEVERLERAYNRALHALHLVDRNDPIAEMVAKLVIKIGASGVDDPTKISEIAIKQLGSPIDRRAIRPSSAQDQREGDEVDQQNRTRPVLMLRAPSARSQFWATVEASRLAKNDEYFYVRRMFEFCLPSSAKLVPDGPEWYHEIKYDGFRLRLERNADRVRLITRGGYDWTRRYPWIEEAALKNRQKHFVIDGRSGNPGR
jgi:ATP-dependent DNA ligase